MSVKTKQSKTPKQGKAEPVEQAEPVESQPKMDFNAAVEQGKQLAGTIKSNKMRLGELADRVQASYGEAKLARFAEEIGVPYETLKKYRTTFRAWKDIDIGAASPSFAVMSTLAPVEARAQIVRANPEMTDTIARKIARAVKGKSKQTKPAPATNGQQHERWIVTETRRWFDDAVSCARATFKFGHPAQERLDPDVLRAAVDDLDQLVDALRKSADATTTLADAVEEARATRPAPQPEPMFDGAKAEAQHNGTAAS